MTEERFCHKLGDQPQLIQGPGMLGAGGDEVDAGGLDAAVAQQVRQLDDVPAGPVEHHSKQVPQIVGEHLARVHPGVPAQPLHLRPDLPAAQLFSAFGAKDCTGGGFLFLGVLEQLPAELFRQ